MGASRIFLAAAVIVAIAAGGGCDGGGGTSGGAPPVNPAPQAIEVTPAEFASGEIVQVRSDGLPGDPASVRLLFSSSNDPMAGGILGVPLTVAPNAISAIVPTGAPTGFLHVLDLAGGTSVPVGSTTVVSAPQVIGYDLPDAPRTPGLIEGDFLQVRPDTVVVYGFNMDMRVDKATLDLVSLDRQRVFHTEEIAVVPADAGVAVTGPTDADPAIRGVRIRLPSRLGTFFFDDAITYLRLTLQAGALSSNTIELPAIPWGWDAAPTRQAVPAMLSGALVRPGVHGHAIEIFYTIFQPSAALKWRPNLETSIDGGATWARVDKLFVPRPDTNDPRDYREDLLIAGDASQTPEMPAFAGPGTTYRLLVNARETWPLRNGRVRLRLTMVSELVSHGESPGLPAGTRIPGNVLELPPIAVFTDYAANDPAFAGKVVETFSTADAFQTEISTGIWGAGGVAKGLTEGRRAMGGGTEPLDQTIFIAGRSYLFDTDSGKLYVFPEDANETDIAAVRAERATDPVRQGLVEVWAGKNAGADLGELHASSLVVPAGVTIYGRGSKPCIVRVKGVGHGIAAQIDGAIVADGLPGGDGNADDSAADQAAGAGPGGAAGPGGGDGGGGGLVRVGSAGSEVRVIEARPARAGRWGGGAGQTMTYLLPVADAAQNVKCFVYGGAGGGGGLGESGGVGRAGDRLDGTNNFTGATPNAWLAFGQVYRVDGAAGPARGSPDLALLAAGAGGGGGGGFLARMSPESTQLVILGVGGGGGGGGGGGAFRLVAGGPVEIAGRIAARGGAGGVGRGKPLPASGVGRLRGDWSGACGGGGSGGAIVIETTQTLRLAPAAELDVSGGIGGRPGETDDDRLLLSPSYPLGGDGGKGRICLRAAGGVTNQGAIIKPDDTTAFVSSVFDGSEVVTYVWSKPISFGAGPGGAVMMGSGAMNTNAMVASLVATAFTSPVVGWNILFDGADERAPRVDTVADFGFLDDLEHLDFVGLKPKAFRFCLVFVGSSTTRETVEVDRLEIPWTPADFHAPAAP